MTPARHKRANAGSVLLAVMLIIVLAALIGTSVLYVADAQRGSATLTLNQAQLRSLAWSGVQGAMAELDAHRGELLTGGVPTLTGEWQLWEGSVGGLVRLTPVGVGAEVAASEAARLDLNIATPAMLAKLPGMNEEIAGKVKGARGQGFTATEELGRIEGLGASLLLDASSESKPSAQSDGPLGGLLSQTTVFAFDPNFDADGEMKVNVSGGWTDELKDQLRERLGDEVTAQLEPIMTKAKKLEKDSDIVALLRSGKVPPDKWDGVLNAITTSDEEFSRGKIDINRAPLEVLSAIPGIDRPTAEKIVDARERLGAEDRQKVTWPLTQGLMKEEAFQEASVWLTTRSLQWRVRVEARLEPRQDGRESLGSALGADGETPDPPGMVWEAVIDVSDTRPRVAYLRDVTQLPGLVRQALAMEQRAEVASSAGESDKSVLKSEVSDERPEPEMGGLKSDAKLKLGSMKSQGLNLGTKLNLGSSNRPEGAASDKGDGAAGPDQDMAGTPPPPAKDRRIGRWRGASKE